jgi:hypothetical protein
LATYHRRQLVALRQALDEARFGSERTLNLRASLPSAEEATRRAEAWLRQQQAARAGEVLVVTGRGNASPGGVSVVREQVVRLLASLRRRGVVADVREHTPGSFVVRLASLRTLTEAPRRRREPAAAPPPADPPAIRELEPETRRLLRRLAEHALQGLGIAGGEPFVEAEMIRQFALLAAGVPDGADREARLRDVIQRAIDDYLEG